MSEMMLHEELYLFPFHDYSLIYPSNRGEIDKKIWILKILSHVPLHRGYLIGVLFKN